MRRRRSPTWPSAWRRWGYGLRQQPALRAIRYANVRFGILPAQSHALTANALRCWLKGNGTNLSVIAPWLAAICSLPCDSRGGCASWRVSSYTDLSRCWTQLISMRRNSVVRTASGRCGPLSADIFTYVVFSRKRARHAVFQASTPLASALQRLARKPQSSIERRTAMKFETLMLNSLFAACVAICVSTLVAMLA